MSHVHSRDTAPEQAIRSLLHRRGLRYRVAQRLDLVGGRVRPDLVFTGPKLAVFVDGCFWHCCPEHGTMPLTNRDFWEAKLLRNVERDRRDDALLAANEWRVVRIWEHEAAELAADRVFGILRGP